MQDSRWRKPPGGRPVLDRRIGPRYPVRPVEYIEVGHNNGGLILDIGEHGIAVAAAQPLGGELTLRLRFQLPNFPEIVETTGEISWIGESRKRAGIRFVDLPASAREQIQKWISQQAATGADEDNAAIIAPVAALELDDSAGTSGLGNGNPFLEAAPQPSIRAEHSENEQEDHLARSQADAGKDANATGPEGERRAHVRKAVDASAYLKLMDGNAGLVGNVSESGLSFRAAKALESDRIFVRFQLPDSDRVIESPALIVWKSGSRKKVGARFVGLPEEAREQIVAWIDARDVLAEPVGPAEKVATFAAALQLHDADPEAVTRSYDLPTLSGAPGPAAASAEHAAVPLQSIASAEKSSTGEAADAVTLPSFLVPRTSAAHKQSASAPVFAEASAPESLLPPIYRASSPAWYETPAKSRSFWKIAAIVILIGGICFGGGIYFSRNRQLASFASDNPSQAAAPDSTAQTNEASPTTNGAGSEAAGPAAAPTAPRESDDAAARSSRKEETDKQRSQEAQTEELRAEAASDSSQSLGAERNRIPPVTAHHEERIQTADSNPSARENAAGRQTQSIASIARAENHAGQSPAGNQEAQPAAATAESPQAETDPAASNLSSPGKSSAVPAPNTTAPPSVSIPPGSVTFFSRFRSIRAANDSVAHPVGSGELQIGTLRTSPIPLYPAEALRQQVQGFVELDVMVGAAGEVQSVRLVKGPAELAAAAASAVKGWQFAPTLLGGRPVETEQLIIFTFKIAR